MGSRASRLWVLGAARGCCPTSPPLTHVRCPLLPPVLPRPSPGGGAGAGAGHPWLLHHHRPRAAHSLLLGCGSRAGCALLWRLPAVPPCIAARLGCRSLPALLCARAWPLCPAPTCRPRLPPPPPTLPTNRLPGTIAERSQEEVYKRAGLISQADDAPGPAAAAGAGPAGQVFCMVCMCDVGPAEATTMECGHTFCNDCWREHMRCVGGTVVVLGCCWGSQPRGKPHCRRQRALTCRPPSPTHPRTPPHPAASTSRKA